jgi:DNA-binding PadR family transcriptional regulator
MERDGLLRSEWRTVARVRRRKYYFITERGKKVFSNSVAEWAHFIERLMQVIGGKRNEQIETILG